jgi:iron complex outermembrane receptor protein
MLMRHKLLVIAIASACFGTCAVANAAVPAPAGQPQDAQATSQNATGTDAKSDANKKGKDKKVQQMQAVQVNGFASSIENATAIKKNASTIVEAVSAEQVGKLPGTSIADSLGRLPGLSMQDVDGRPQVLSIHGLGPDFSTALVNGGQQVSTSDNRDVQFDQYPASWFQNVVVHLSPEADLIGQGLAGTVDMQTIRPLDKSGPEGAINAKYIWNSMSQLGQGPGAGNTGYNVNGVWVDQFADHTVGVTLGVDFENNPTQIEHQGPWGYYSGANRAGADPAQLPDILSGIKNYGASDNMKRNGLLATFEWKPNDVYTGTVDLTYDNYKETLDSNGVELPMWYGSTALSPVPTPVVGNVVGDSHLPTGYVQSGAYNNVNPIIENYYNRTTARVYNFDWDNQFHINEDWSADVKANYSRATRNDYDVESIAGTGYYYGNNAYLGANGITGNGPAPAGTFGFNQLPDGMFWITPGMNLTNGMVLTDPNGWGAGQNVVQAGFINAPSTVDWLANLRMSVERDFDGGPFSSMQFGVSRTTRNKTYNITQDFLTPGGADGSFFTNGYSPTLSAALPGSGTCNSLAWMGIASIPCYNPLALIANGTYTEVPAYMSSLSIPPNWKVRETDLNPYLQFNIDTNLGNVGLRGNVGIQVDHTDQSSTGGYVTAGGSNIASKVTVTPVSGGTSYTRWLPSANLIFGFTDNDDLRVSAARTMAQPEMSQMNASQAVTGNIQYLSSTNYEQNQSYFSASGGNAKLLPSMADNYNVSYEHYFSGPISGYTCNDADSKASDICRNGGGGYIAVSGYFLHLYDFINPNAAYLYDFSSFIPNYLNPAQQAELGTPMGLVSGPINDGRGYVKGAEVTVNLPFGLFTPVLDGFGTILTGNRTASSMVYGTGTTPITVPGLSKWVADGTLYYQHGGFEARVSDSYRSTFLGETYGLSGSLQTQTIKGGSTVDAQVSYTFDHGTFKGLTLIATGSNLTNKLYDTFQNNDPRQVLVWEEYGRTYSLGLSYKFQ